MKIKFEEMKVVVDNGLVKVKYTLGCLALWLACIGLYIYVFKKSGWKGLIKLWIALLAVEAGAWGIYFFNVDTDRDNWFTKLYSKAADWIGFSWSINLDEEE